MSIRLYTHIDTPAIYEPSTIVDAVLAAGQAALVATQFSLSNAKTGAIIGLALRIASKINEYVLNYIYKKTVEFTGPHITLSFLRKAVEITASAGLVYLAITLLVPSISLTFSKILIFAALEDIRPIRTSRETMKGNVIVKGLFLPVTV